jgi:SP family arabinose:H+ symporter-like MFS transporter
MLFGILHSARWLVTQNRVAEAYQALQAIGVPDAEAELKEIVGSIDMERSSYRESLFVRRYRVPILLAITIAIFNQLSGINAVLYYLNDIFVAVGFSRLSGSLQAVIGAP